MASLTEAIKNVLNELKNADVTFNISNEDIPAHKFILSLRSPVLKVMIENPMAYVDGKILITDPDITVADFKAFIKFLYTDECEITRQNMKTMLHLGNMYDVPLLIEKCVKFFERDLRAANLLEYAEIGLLYSDQCRILTECLKKIPFYFFCNPPDPLFSTVFLFVESSNGLVLKIVQDVERINGLTEEKLFKVIMEWANQTCLTNCLEPNPSNLKEALIEIIPFIKFENLKPITLVEKVWENNFLSPEEYINCLNKSIISQEASTKTNINDRSCYSPADSMSNNISGCSFPIRRQNFDGIGRVSPELLYPIAFVNNNQNIDNDVMYDDWD